MEAERTLESLREQIDEIDLAVFELVAKRFTITNEVGQLKVRQGLAASDPEREAKQIERARVLAEAAGFNPDLAEQVLRLVIAEVVRRHHEIASDDAGSEAADG